MTLDLPPELESALVDAARREGTTPEALALRYLRERLLSAPNPDFEVARSSTLADFLAGHIGVLDSKGHVPGGANLSEQTGQRFAAGLIERREQGRL